MALYQWGPNQVQLFQRQPDNSLVRVPGDGVNADFLAWSAIPGNVPDLDTDDGDIAAFPSRVQVLTALTQLNADLTTLSGTPTNAQLVAILNRTVTNQRAIIKALAALVRRQGG